MSGSAEEWSLDRGAGICSALRDRAALEARVRVLRVRWVFLFLVPLLESVCKAERASWTTGQRASTKFDLARNPPGTWRLGGGRDMKECHLDLGLLQARRAKHALLCCQSANSGPR